MFFRECEVLIVSVLSKNLISVTVTLIVSDSTVCLNASVKADSFITARRDFSLIIVNKWTYSFAAMTENTLEANTIYSQLNRT